MSAEWTLELLMILAVLYMTGVWLVSKWNAHKGEKKDDA